MKKRKIGRISVMNSVWKVLQSVCLVDGVREGSEVGGMGRGMHRFVCCLFPEWDELYKSEVRRTNKPV